MHIAVDSVVRVVALLLKQTKKEKDVPNIYALVFEMALCRTRLTERPFAVRKVGIIMAKIISGDPSACYLFNKVA